jgi:hypothetical protein
MAEKIVPPIVVGISGEPKSGKTHLAFTFPPPIKLYSFDIGADFVSRKFSDKTIEIVPFDLPIIDSDPPPPYAEALWDKFEKMYKADVEGGKYKTLVIDTATALWQILVQGITEAKHRKKILEVEYHLPNLKMSALFTNARRNGVNLVTTQYLREKYIDEKKTGDFEIDGWKRTAGQVDIDLWIESIDKGDSHLNRSTIKKARFGRELNNKAFDDLTYQRLIALCGA